LYNLTGGVILLQGQFNNFKDTLSFILDTGSGGISLDSTTVEYFWFKGNPSNRTIKGIAGEKKVSFLYNSKLKFPGITIDKALIFISMIISILTSVYGERIDGIIGHFSF
jgi:hypothetical protein